MKKLKVVIWGTGEIGSAAMPAINQHPNLELVGAKVYTEAKHGLDVGDIFGIGKTGAIANINNEEVLALEADCVLYAPMMWNVDEICSILESGKHLVTPAPYVYPDIQLPEDTAKIEAACQKGGVNFYADGINPGITSIRIPLMYANWCSRIDSIRTSEVYDGRSYEGELALTLFNMGFTEEESANNPVKGMLPGAMNQPLDLLAKGLGLEVVSYKQEHDVVMSNQTIQVAAGTIKEGASAYNHFRHIAYTKEGVELMTEQYWFMDDPAVQSRLQRKIDLPLTSGWQMEIKGEPGLIVNADFTDSHSPMEHHRKSWEATANCCIHAIPAVCSEKGNPGIKTPLDLPFLTPGGVAVDSNLDSVGGKIALSA